MKILMVNKFLYKKGGAEVYTLKLGKYLEKRGHEVQYFGMDSFERCVGNKSNEYVSNMNLREVSRINKIKYLFKIIYSFEARRKIRIVLEKFRPDIVHLNNINYQLTPAIIYEIKKHEIPIIQTVHDSQIVCPSHRLYIERTKKICERCIDGNYINCIKERCIHNSKSKSIAAAVESYYYHFRKTYNLIDKFICPSNFIAEKIMHGGIDKGKTEVICNFTDKVYSISKKSDRKYIIYFGRLSVEKGIDTLIKVCRKLKNISFVIAGTGPLEDDFKDLSNVEYVGFKTGEELQKLISEAVFSLYPSEWYENCPLSVIESQSLGTPVLGSDLGGTKELIIEGKTGLLFKAGDIQELEEKIEMLWNSSEIVKRMSEECLKRNDNTIDKYYEKVIKVYKEVIKNRGI